MKILFHVAVGLALCADTGLAQRVAEPRQGGYGPPIQPGLIYYEAVNTPSAVPGRSRLTVSYRVDLSFFIGIRGRNSMDGGFVRKGEIQIELIDTTGHMTARDIRKFRAETDGNELLPATTWHEGIMDFDIAPGRYSIALSLEDIESERRIADRSTSVAALDFASGSQSASPPFPVRPQGDDTDRLILQNYGGGFRYGRPGAFAVVITNAPSADPYRITYTVSGRGKGQDSLLTKTLDILPRTGIALQAPDGGSAPVFGVVPSGDENHSLLLIACDVLKLHPGVYSITLALTQGSWHDTTTTSFDLVWPDIPRSLRDLRYAFESLRYITTPDELDSLRSGSEDESGRRFREFWTAKDRTPETAYNEVMTEYYIRIDEAATRFGTLRSPDGSRTDRGRIYVLYGSPTHTERRLDPSGFIEAWSYKGISKRFIFLDELKTGDYVLTATQPL